MIRTVLAGTNVPDDLISVKPAGIKDWVRRVRIQHGEKADQIVAVYPDSTDAQALQSSCDLFGDALFAWPTYACENLETTKGKSRVLADYYAWRREQTESGGRLARSAE